MVREWQLAVLDGHDLVGPLQEVAACDERYLSSSGSVTLRLSMDCCRRVSTSTLSASFFFSMMS